MKHILEAQLLNGYSSKVPRGCSFCGGAVPPNRRINCSTICTKRKNHIKRTKSSRYGKSEGYDSTATGKSVFWEGWFVNKFGGEWMNEDVMGKPYDVEWNGKKIDVKVAEYFVRKSKKGKPWYGSGVWTFKPNAFLKSEIDYFACICLLNNKALKVLLIPSDIYQICSGICVGKKSKYDIFNIYPCNTF